MSWARKSGTKAGMLFPVITSLLFPSTKWRKENISLPSEKRACRFWYLGTRDISALFKSSVFEQSFIFCNLCLILPVSSPVQRKIYEKQ